MQKYLIEVTETLQKTIEIIANSESEAIGLVKEKYYHEEIVLNETNYIETTFEVRKDWLRWRSLNQPTGWQ